MSIHQRLCGKTRHGIIIPCWLRPKASEIYSSCVSEIYNSWISWSQSNASSKNRQFLTRGSSICTMGHFASRNMQQNFCILLVIQLLISTWYRRHKMEPILLTCTTCDSEFQMGPGVYTGKWIPLYQMHVCNSCHYGNCDGFAPHYDSRILKHLKDNGIPIPARNARGFLPPN